MPTTFFGWVGYLVQQYGSLFLRGTGVTLLIAISGTVLGVLVIATIKNGLTLCNVNSFIQMIVEGSILIAAVVLDLLRNGAYRRAS